MEYTITELKNAFVLILPTGEASNFIRNTFEGFIWKSDRQEDFTSLYFWNMDENDVHIIETIKGELHEREYTERIVQSNSGEVRDFQS